MAAMKTALVTGAAGFIGRNLCEALARRSDLRLLTFDVTDPADALEARVADADVVFHLAGVNRPQREEEFQAVNAGLVLRLVAAADARQCPPVLVLSSSTQAALDNPYGRSKREAEDALRAFAERRGSPVRVFRLPGVFGKWCRPDYNSVVATFCYRIARDLEIVVSDPERAVDLVYIDDVVAAFASLLADEPEPGAGECEVQPVYRVTLGRLVALIRGFRDIRRTLFVPDLSDPFTARLHATYLSYQDPSCLAFQPPPRADARGSLAELLKSPHCGQLFVSRTRPGVTRGNHYHDTKVERFCVVEGTGIIRLRHLVTHEIVSYAVSGGAITLVEIPPGYTHAIENTGEGDLVTLFWASEPFDPERPDTYAREVLNVKA